MTIIRCNFEKILATIVAISLLFTLVPMTTLDVKAQMDGSFIFTVNDEQGESVEDAAISIELSDGDAETILTDGDGIAEFDGLMPNTQYPFTVEKEGYDEFSGVVSTDDDGAGNYDVILNTTTSTPLPIEGIITFAGEGIAGAEILIVGEDDVTTSSDENGEFAIHGLEDGNYTVIVVADGYKVRQYEVDSAQWNEIELEQKDEQEPFAFEHDSIDIYFGQNPIPNELIGGSGDGEITYYIENEEENKDVAIIDPATGAVSIIGVGMVNIIATKAGDDNFNRAVASYTLNVKFHDFWHDSLFINGNVQRQEWYTEDVIISTDDDYLIFHYDDSTDEEEWLKSLPPLTEEGTHIENITLRRESDNATSVMEEFRINIDKTSPSDIQVNVDESSLNKSDGNVDYHNGAATISISAIDEISGVREFIFKHGADERVIKPTEVDGDMYSVTIKTLPNNSGRISITAVDNAGNISEKYESDRVITTDNVKPKLEVKLNSATRKIGDKSYYNKDIVVEVKVTEKNFNWNVVAKISRDGGATEWWRIYNWVNDGDVWTGSFTLTGDAEYSIEIECEDESGNKAQSYKGDGFIIDTIRPAINISFSDSGMKNHENGIAYFGNGRRATITIHERNFNADDVEIDITAKNSSGDDIDFKVPTGWKSSGDTHTLTINFDKEANYQLGIDYTDLVGNSANKLPKETFTVDKGAPKLSSDDIVFRHKNNGKIAKFINFISFGYFSKEAIEVTITGADGISGVESITYYIVGEDGRTRLTDDVFIKNNPKNKSSQVVKFELKPDFKGYIFAKARDYSLNESKYVKSRGLIIESSKSHNSIKDAIVISPHKNANKNGIYNDDFIVDIKVKDEISGINSIQYTVGSSAEEKIDFTQKSDITYSWSKSIRVNASKNNNNNVVIKVKYTDNAGFSSEEIKTYKIDVTSPVIATEFSRDINEQGGYINSDLVATLSIEELNFNAKDVEILITKDGTPIKAGKLKWTSSGNIHSTKINFNQDGEYTLTAKYTDLAGNSANYKKIDEFTIDKTAPQMQIEYDNNNVSNGNYYSDARRATITINERNFDSDNVMITMTAQVDGNDIAPPTVNGWSTNGDVHTATIDFTNDALYELDISFIDMAGNDAINIPRQTFYVDRTAPTLEISGVKDRSANNDSVIPVISYSDVNLDNEGVSISLVGANRGQVDITGTYTDVKNGRIFTFADFERTQEIDDIYTLTATVSDRAGNEVSQNITFSVNRFGSTYAIGDSTKAILDQYIQNEIELEITEINVDSLEKYNLKYSRDGVVYDLVEGDDYTVSQSGGDGQWKEYNYRIFAKNFSDEGNYIVTIYSEDRAQNLSDNKIKKKEIRFSIDKTAPICIATGIESNMIYSGNNQRLMFNIKDNIATDNVKVMLDGELLKEWEGSSVISLKGDFELLISSANYRRNLEIIYTDKAGNTDTTKIENFLISTNAFIRFYENKPVFIGSIVGTISFIVAVTLIIYRRKKMLD